MTREEAIAVLQKIKPTPCRGDGKSTTHALEIIAIDTAIKALEQEPCGKDINVPATDAISRQAVDDAIYDYSRSCDVNYQQIMEFIEKIPSVTPQPKTGHWIQTGAEELPFGVTIPELTCSTCGWSSALMIPRNYCPKCGTKMEERGKNDN